jgi:hypothetical protein
VTLATSAVIALPAQLGEVAGRDKLKLLGKAHLDFEKKHKRLCAAYSTDANGNKLLSWRVHVLPFLGHDELYNKFRLDEPWDSTHNMLLAEEMPGIYRHPTMKLDPNKTVYVVSTRDDAVFGSPTNANANPPLGLELKEVTDDAATTIMVLELNRKHQVFWTQPEDTEANGKLLQTMVRGIRDSSSFFAVMLNGDVYSLTSWTSFQTLDQMFSRNDGHTVKLPRQFFR